MNKLYKICIAILVSCWGKSYSVTNIPLKPEPGRHNMTNCSKAFLNSAHVLLGIIVSICTGRQRMTELS
jgi:hypothetical protein